MSKSNLCERIYLCDLISRLNRDGCLMVIRLFQLENGCAHDNLNQWLIQMAMTMTQNMNVKSITRISSRAKQIACNDELIDTDSIESKTIKISINDGNTIFPLMRLPADIITNTSLFLNENDIFNFEQCCRLFYQMINNLSYLKQTKNFQTFIIDKQRFDQMIEQKYSFYKFSQATSMNMAVYVPGAKTNNDITKFVNQSQPKWDQIKCICMDKYNGYWLTNVFKSIKSLKLSADATIALLDKLPLKILFDPQSKLEMLKINHYWNVEGNFGHLQRAIDDFEKEYLQLKEKYQQQGKKIKKLKCLDCSCWTANYTLTGPRHIEAQHLILHNVCNGFAATHLFSTISVLTCFLGFTMVDRLDKIDCNIETLRLMKFCEYGNTDICMNNKLIQALNLHRNLMNLTIEIDLCMSIEHYTAVAQWIKSIETILCKQYYHNLQNVNILIKMFDKNIECVFNILKKNVSILKCQFKQLNIGLKVYGKYCTFEWDLQIDEKYLDQQKQEWNDGDKRKYKQWLNQWTS